MKKLFGSFLGSGVELNYDTMASVTFVSQQGIYNA